MRLPTFSRHSLQRILAISLTLLISACGGPKSTFSTQPDSSNEWTWVDGSDTWNATAVYGQKGTASLGNIPGARGATADWTDRTGNFWLFGGTLAMSGVGEASVGNDLWKYDVTAQEWTWVGGSRVANQPGTYGMLDTASSSNIPGGRKPQPVGLTALATFGSSGA